MMVRDMRRGSPKLTTIMEASAHLHGKIQLKKTSVYACTGVV